MRRPHSTLLAALAAGLVLAAAPAGAQPRVFSGIPATARTQHGRFVGTVSVTRFAASAHGVLAKLVITGTVHDTRYPHDVTFRQPAKIPVRLTGAGCSAVVAIGPAATYVWGLPAKLAARRVRVGGSAGCKLTSAHGTGAQAAALERLRRARG